MKAGKIWGVTELLVSNDSLEFHRIEFKAKAQCSKHKHKLKWNGFFVESGSLTAPNNTGLTFQDITGSNDSNF